MPIPISTPMPTRIGVTYSSLNRMAFGLCVVFLFIQTAKLLIYQGIVNWDEAVYLGMGKYIYSGGTAGLWEFIRPPGLPLLLGWLWKAGLPYIFAAKLVVIVLGVGNIALVYLIGAQVFDKRVGFVAALLLATTPDFLFHTARVFTHVPSTFFVLLAVYFFVRGRRLLPVGIFAAVAFILRFPYALLFPAFVVLLVIHRERFSRCCMFGAGWLVVFVPFLIVNCLLYEGMYHNYFHAAFGPLIYGVERVFSVYMLQEQAGAHFAVSGFWPNVFYYPAAMVKGNFLLLFALPGVVFLARRALRQKNVLSVLIPFAIIFMFYALITNKQMRFSLEFLPLVCLIAAAGLFGLAEILKTRTRYLLFVFLFSLHLTSVAFVTSKRAQIVSSVPAPGQGSIAQSKKDMIALFAFIKTREGRYLTTSPLAAAYTDHEYLPAYETIDSLSVKYHRYKDSVDYILFFESFDPCRDKDCAAKAATFARLLFAENHVIYRSGDQDPYYILQPNKPLDRPKLAGY